MRAKRTLNVYVDGFALYKSLLQYQYPQYKWLDLVALSQRLFPHRTTTAVKFFTAPLKPMTSDPGIGQRQQIYWRALRITGVEIVEGKFSFVRQRLPIHPTTRDPEGKVLTVKVKRPEEKGTDVALATHLLVDAFNNKADTYAIITNDSDLVPPIKVLAERGHNLALVSVAGEEYNKAFDTSGIKTIRQIREGTLKASQFPERITDLEGRVIKKPPRWL